MNERLREPLRLAVVRRRYAPFGGAERFIERSLDELQGMGIASTLVCADWDRTVSNDPRWEVVRLDVRAGMSRARNEANFDESLRSFLMTRKFDLVQSHERIPGLPIFRAGDGLHCEWLRQRRRIQSGFAQCLTRLDPYHRFCLRREHELYNHPALRVVICNSEMVRSEIAEHFPVALPKVRVIRNGIDVSAFFPPSQQQRAEARFRLGIPEDRVLFTFVGSGFERKGVATILRVAGLAPKARFLIVGQDKQLSSYQRRARRLGVAGRVHFLGPTQDVASCLNAGDAFIFPTLYDPGPNAVLEAMATGLPILTSEKCGLAEVVVPAGAGYAHDALDIAAFASSVERLLDPQLRLSMGAAARQAAEQLSLDALGENLHSLYRELLP